mmetsp:Transcript_17259/g.60628  ORF Transcript_17259/g.60628 Transcript_17259/m.60628 type:complete len:349 (+) Transcript_17259:80-1126(+)
MHGRKKPAKGEGPSDEEVAAGKKKLAKYSGLLAMARKQMAAGDMSVDALKVNGKMLVTNPDVYDLWNYRRRVLQAATAEADATAVADIVAGELALTQEALASKNPKSYCVWHHRQWMVENYEVVLDKELALCGKFLEYDERNFHCWNYRRWVATRAGVSAKDEFDFTTQKINRNFSNYSAWHYRSKLFPRRAKELQAAGDGDGSVGMALLAPELELVRQAAFTEPDDQSAWMYQRWLFGQVARILQAGGAEADAARAALEAELESCRELHEVEEGSKWPPLAMAVILQLLSADGDGGDAKEEVQALYSTLQALDPAHAAYYRYAARNGDALVGRLLADGAMGGGGATS